MQRSKIFFVVVLILVGFAFIESNTKQFEISKNLEIFANLYKELNTNYVDDLDPSKLMRTGIESMLGTLDPYTNYISEADIESYRYMAEGKYDGIGARVLKMGDYVTIVEPYEEGPAMKAGLLAGDQILAVDGRDAKGKKTDEVEDILRGFPGTDVTLTMKRPGQKESWDVVVKRDEVTVKNVPHYSMLSEDIGYVVLTTFTSNAGRNVADAIQQLKNENPNMRKLVFDLRDNGGGFLREAVSISNLFIPRDEVVVTTRGKVKDRDRSFKTKESPMVPDMPVVVLTNKWTASASEIVSGVLQDLDRGVIVGQRTYGKGLVQNTVDLEYNAKLKLTTAKYYIPSGRCIQSVSYSEGEPLDIPDSERAKFKTRGGRSVLDGGGITPDVKIDDRSKSSIVSFLEKNNLIFHYATGYFQSHPTIPEPGDFRFEEFDEFVEFVKSKNLEFKTKTETELEELQEAAKADHLEGVVQEQIKSMLQTVAEEKADDLYEYREEITDLIEKDIVTRYYYQTGKIKKSLQNDSEIEVAVELLNDMSKYESLLKESN
ncbi:MAG: S41 family peptidase [Saprospiraceae bacterium]|nr:S41 family peptidase [Saprospiraceae bacterium]